MDHQDVKVAVVICGQDARPAGGEILSATNIQAEYQVQQGLQHKKVQQQGKQSARVNCHDVESIRRISWSSEENETQSVL